MTRDVRQIFAAIDSLEPDRFVSHLAPDVVFAFGNAQPAVGRDAVRDAVSGFFSTIAGLTHHIEEIWDVGPDTTVVKINVEYRRQDRKVVHVPNANILRWKGDEVVDWQIYIDLAPVFA